MQHLVNYFLQDQDFPRDSESYRDLYEGLYLGLYECKEINRITSKALLRLAEARLERMPQACERVWHDLRAWFSTPVPVLEEAVLEAFDLLAEYGLPGGALSEWYREWLTPLLALPRDRDPSSLAAWRLFGEWIQPGADLLD
ncbi:MAG TPA: hypothetical protein VHB98_09785, partial [Chloroflexota bacterium]|nr:hypothetical protein [Chloroflexota bacterium]